MVESLRERKKARTRREISDVATRLFMEHGFEQVTLAQIADAAEVSVKTIFNHFGSKEDLYFDRIGEWRDGVVATITEREAGTTVLQAMHRLMTDDVVPFPGRGWGMGEAGGLERFKRFLATQDASPTLSGRWLVLAAELHRDLRVLLAEELGRTPDDDAILALAAGLNAANTLRDELLRTSLAAGLSLERTRKRVVAAMDDTFLRLERAFEDVDRPA